MRGKNMKNTFINIDLIKNAYRKLKSYAYFDKTHSALREKIVDFEKKEKNVEEELKNICNDIKMLISISEDNIQKLNSNEIGVILYPKKLKRNKNLVGTNMDFNESIDIYETQAFFDATIKVHLIGVLWTMIVGVEIDKQLSDYMYGNRIKESMKGHKTSVGPSPYLMKPYFEQYQTWRSGAISCLEHELKNNNELVMINIDLKRYFYQVNFNEKTLIDYLENHLVIKDKHQLNLTKLIHHIANIYTNQLKEFEEFKDVNDTILPIGFYPSLIISNWYLKSFDKKFINSKTLYYGRYVDDILMIYSIKENDEIKQILKQINSDKDKYLINSINILNKLYNRFNKNDDPWSFLSEDQKSLYPGNMFNENNMFTFEETYIINASKLSITYFNSEYTTSMIDEFKTKIWKNASEFRLIPDDIFEIDYGKLFEKSCERENLLKINSLDIDKYELSKFLGKHLYIAKNIKDNKIAPKLNELLKMLDKQNLIDIYLQWENLLTLFLMTKQPLIKNLITKILISIDSLTMSTKNTMALQHVKNSLNRHFSNSFYRSASLLNKKSILENINLEEMKKYISIDENNLLDYRVYNMTNKNHLGVIPGLIKNDINKDINLFDLNQIIENINYEHQLIKSLCNENPSKNSEYYLLPYNVSLSDLQLLRLYKRLNDGKFVYDSCRSDFDIISSYWLPINGYDHEGTKVFNNKICISEINPNDCGQSAYESKAVVKRIFTYEEKEQFDEAYVGVGNVSINNHQTYFDSIRTKTEDRSLKRYQNLKETFNTVIKYGRISRKKTNLVVLPEIFVPFEWINLLISVSKKNDMAIISGLEHIQVKGKYYNFLVSIFPVKIDDFIMISINFHLKVHYSPLEEQELGTKNLVNGMLYEMHKWRGLNIVPYYCYELTSIHDRALFKDDGVNLIAASVFNKDVDYFSNIIESISRETNSFVIQANDSFYGDSRVFQPAKKFEKNLMRVSGGLNHTALISKLEAKSLKDHLKRPKNIQLKSKKWKIKSI